MHYPIYNPLANLPETEVRNFCFPQLEGQQGRTSLTVSTKSPRVYSRPVGFIEHGPDAPGGAEHVEGFGEAVVVDEASVGGEQPHQQDDVATTEHHVEHLVEKPKRNKGIRENREGPS